MDYVHILTRLPKLQDQIEEDNEDGRPAVADAAVSQEIDDLTRRVPRIIGILPDVFYRSWTSDRRHAAATEEMVKNLLATTEKTKPIALVRISLLCFYSDQKLMIGAKCRHRFSNPL